MHVDTPLTAANMQLASVCPETRAPDAALARFGLQRQSDGTVVPASGGPVCELVDHGITKLCWGGSPKRWQIVSEWQYLVPPFVDNHDEIVSLWHHVENITRNHWLRACTAGGIGGVIAGASGGAGGALAGATGGCVTGVLAYWWLDKD
jgi:hypothetical protein